MITKIFSAVTFAMAVLLAPASMGATAATPASVSLANPDCNEFENCVLICLKMSGDRQACEIACMDTICTDEPNPPIIPDPNELRSFAT